MTRLKRFMGALMAALLMASLSMAQGPKKDVGKSDEPAGGDEQYVVSVDVDLVTLDVVVTEKHGHPISGLQKQHFTILEDGVPQVITHFSPIEAPLTVVILVEFSDTIGFYLDDVLGPVAGFIESLRPEDWGALVAFDMRPEILVDFTKNKRSVMNGLGRLTTPSRGETALYDAVYDTLERLESVRGKKAIFLLSAGLDTFSKHSYSDVLKKAESSDTMIYSVGMGQLARARYELSMSPLTSITFTQADNVMRSLAQLSGGMAFFPMFAGEYPDVYESVSAHLRHQYSLGYVSSNPRKDGKLRKVKVEVPRIDVDSDGKPDKLKVRHKKGYRLPT